MASKEDREPFSIKVGDQYKVVQLPNYYSEVSQYLGLNKISGIVPANYGKGSSSQLMLDGQAAKVRISWKLTIGNKKKYRTTDLLCDLDNYKTALGTLPGKSFRGTKIVEAYVPRRRRLG